MAPPFAERSSAMVSSPMETVRPIVERDSDPPSGASRSATCASLEGKLDSELEVMDEAPFATRCSGSARRHSGVRSKARPRRALREIRLT